MPDGRINNNQLLEPIMDLVAGQAEVKEKVSNIEIKLDTHLEECSKILIRPEKNGKKINRRKLSLFQKIMITIAVATFLGGCTIGKYILDDIYGYIDNKYEQIKSE